MTDTTTEDGGMGGNSREDLANRAKRLVQLGEDIDKLKAEEKLVKEAAKNDGYDTKALAKIVKELRKGPKYQAAQLELEMVLDTYRTNAGLPTDLEDAQQRAREAAESMPEDDSEGSSFAEGSTVRFGDGPEIPARDFERAAKRAKRGTVN